MKIDNIIQNIEKARLSVNEHLIVKIVAVSKYVGAKEVETLYNAGQRAFGENRVQVLEEKINELSSLPLEWHFIGNLQKNKINKLLSLNPSLIQSINSFELASEINKRADKKIDCLLEINSAKEASKEGLNPEQAIEEYLKIKEELPNINLKGVMTIGAHTDEQREIQSSFELTYKLFENLKPHGAKICSMGMSSDYELAIKCGSNMVRIGRAIF
jgi:pyridoxal phosphate enzyme (YggS family)